MHGTQPSHVFIMIIHDTSSALPTQTKDTTQPYRRRDFKLARDVLFLAPVGAPATLLGSWWVGRSSTSPQRLRGIERKWRLMPPLSAYIAPRHVGMCAPDARGSAAALPMTAALNKLAHVCHT